MDNKFLNKVVDQIVSETRIDYDMGEIQFPFSSLHSPLLSTYSLLSPLFIPFLHLPLFTKHCKDVYGLNDDEVEYVWEEYKDIINEKIESNG